MYHRALMALALVALLATGCAPGPWLLMEGGLIISGVLHDATKED